MDVRKELEEAANAIEKAKEALEEEHEGNFTIAIRELDRISMGLYNLVRNW